MSYNVKFTADFKVAKEILNQRASHMPAYVKTAIESAIDDCQANILVDAQTNGRFGQPPTAKVIVQVEAYGHSGGGWPNIGKLEVQAIWFYPEPTAAPVATAAPESLPSETQTVAPGDVGSAAAVLS